MLNLQKVLERYAIKANINMLLEIWNESNREYDLGHLTDLIERINELYLDGKINEKEKDLLYLTSIFHRINENDVDKSSEFFVNLCGDKSLLEVGLVKEAIENKNSIGKFFKKIQPGYEETIESLVEKNS